MRIAADNNMEPTFHPRCDGDPGKPAPAERLRVLIVEDQAFVALDCEAALLARGHDVVAIAADAQSAAAMAEQYRPDVILMDVRLSGARTGLEAAIEIYRKLGIRCVFASAHAEEDFTRQLAEPAHPLGWLGKPYTCDEMISLIESATAQRQSDLS